MDRRCQIQSITIAPWGIAGKFHIKFGSASQKHSRKFDPSAFQFPAALFLSLAPGFSRVIERPDAFNRFSGLQAPKNR